MKTASGPRGQRLVPHIVDYRAEHEPERTILYLPKGDNLEDGWYPLTYGLLAPAVDRTCIWLNETLGTSPIDKQETVAYIGASDYRYVLLQHACVKTNRQLLTPMLYNTLEGQLKLLEATDCQHILASSSHFHYWKGVIDAKSDLHIIEVPPLDNFLGDHLPPPARHFSFNKTFAEAKDDIWLVAQSSGTTGTPKALFWSIAQISLEDEIAEASGSLPLEQQTAIYPMYDKSLNVNTFPMSWAAGSLHCSMRCFFLDLHPLLPPPSAPVPMTASYLDKLHTLCPHAPKMTMNIIPSVLRDLTRSPPSLERLKMYTTIIFVGAPLDDETGSILTANGIRVRGGVASTDLGSYPLLWNDRIADWNFHRFPPAGSKTALGYELDPFVEDKYELVVRRLGPDDPRPVFAADRDLDVYRTKDLWQDVPGRKGFVTMVGRTDDFVKLSSMTKFNAVEIERDIDSRSDLVAGCIVGGDGRQKSFVIVQPADKIEGLTDGEVVERVWPAIEKANQRIFEEARLSKDLVIVAKKEKPIVRTMKATVDRRKTLALYEDEVNEAYGRTGGREIVKVFLAMNNCRK